MTTPVDLGAATRAWNVVRESLQSFVSGVVSMWDLIPDEVRQSAAANAGIRYWTDQQGRARRTTGMKPLLHNGRKP